jgi:ABC-type Zn uptake system ZnuABC Zn-binding protein ZnuA
MILRELVGDRGEVGVLLPPGASPHHYEPKPSDARLAELALATFYFDFEVDGWASKLAGDRAVAIADSTNYGAKETHHHNPHVWLDPIAVRQLLPALCENLIRLDPEGESVYRLNAAQFNDRLMQLDAELKSMFEDVGNRGVIQAHASWDLFFERYGIPVVGVLETTPGAVLPPQQFARLVDAASDGKVFALIAEPQLPRAPLEILAADTVPIVEMDPIGGGDTTYEAFIRTNAKRLVGALQ